MPAISLEQAGFSREEVTVDGFLGGVLRICQPKTGYRAGSDAVLLGATVHKGSVKTILDVGCGVGTAGLCALHRLTESTLWGLELQPDLCALACLNAEENNLQESAHFAPADIGDRKSLKGLSGPAGKPLLEAGFDHVITNPPYYEKGRARQAGTVHKTLSHIEGEVALKDWLEFCVARVKTRGLISLIHRADRLADILKTLSAGCGSLTVIPLWPEAGMSAKRVIVTGVKGDRGPLELTRGLILHEKDGRPTMAAEQISRHGAALDDVL